MRRTFVALSLAALLAAPVGTAQAAPAAQPAAARATTPCGDGYSQLDRGAVKTAAGTKLARARLYALVRPDDLSVVSVRFCLVVDLTRNARENWYTRYKLSTYDPDGTWIERSDKNAGRARTVEKLNDRQEVRRAVAVVKVENPDTDAKLKVKLTGTIDQPCPDIICANN